MKLPITYIPDVFSKISFEDIDKELIWENFGAPRSEAYYAIKNVPYTYGKGTGERTYWPYLWDKCGPIIREIWNSEELFYNGGP